MWNNYENETIREVFNNTNIIRKPISGIVSGYHELPYILISPHEKNPTHSIEVNGKINVSPKFIISPSALNETFGDVFDAETFDKDIEGRIFSFAYGGKKNIKVENEYFQVHNYEENVDDRINRILDDLMREENTRTGLIFGPNFHYYPVSLDRFISEVIDREFRA